jgi:hypothetical protein
MNEKYTVWIPIVISIVTALITYGFFNWKAVLSKLNVWMLTLLGKTPTVLDEQLYTILVQHVAEYMNSDDFKGHWLRVNDIVKDGKITDEELAILKNVFIKSLAQDLIKVGINVYSNEGRILLVQAIDEFTAFVMKNATDMNWFKRVGLGLIMSSLNRWIKEKIEGWILQSKVTTIKIYIR